MRVMQRSRKREAARCSPLTTRSWSSQPAAPLLLPVPLTVQTLPVADFPSTPLVQRSSLVAAEPSTAW